MNLLEKITKVTGEEIDNNLKYEESLRKAIENLDIYNFSIFDESEENNEYALTGKDLREIVDLNKDIFEISRDLMVETYYGTCLVGLGQVKEELKCEYEVLEILLNLTDKQALEINEIIKNEEIEYKEEAIDEYLEENNIRKYNGNDANTYISVEEFKEVLNKHTHVYLKQCDTDEIIVKIEDYNDPNCFGYEYVDTLDWSANGNWKKADVYSKEEVESTLITIDCSSPFEQKEIYLIGDKIIRVSSSNDFNSFPYRVIE